MKECSRGNLTNNEMGRHLRLMRLLQSTSALPGPPNGHRALTMSSSAASSLPADVTPPSRDARYDRVSARRPSMPFPRLPNHGLASFTPRIDRCETNRTPPSDAQSSGRPSRGPTASWRPRSWPP